MHSFTLARPWSRLSLSLLRPNPSCMHRRYISVYFSDKTTKQKIKKMRCQPLKTLDPRSLSPRDFRDFSNQKVFKFPAAGRSFVHYERRTVDGKSIYAPFPDQTRGFLYYWTHPDLPPTSGQIRFRITRTPNPKDFDGGRDFCLSSGIPWHSTLAYLAGNKNYAGICDVLVQDGFVTRDVIEQLRPLSEYVRLMPRQATVLTSPREIFPISLPMITIPVYLASPGESKQFRKINISLKNNEEMYKFVEPGKQVFALAQFLYPKRYDSKNRVPHLRLAHVYTSDGPVVSEVLSSIKPHSMHPRRDFIAWCKEFH